jgi:hypothetical protein
MVVVLVLYEEEQINLFPSPTFLPSPFQFPGLQIEESPLQGTITSVSTLTGALTVAPSGVNALRGAISATSVVTGRVRVLGAEDAPAIDLPTPLQLDPHVTELRLAGRVTTLTLDSSTTSLDLDPAVREVVFDG